MPRDLTDLSAHVAGLNDRYRHHAATAVLERALSDDQVGNIAMVSSFGAESVVLLHMVAVINPATPVLFIDTQMLFEETMQYQRDVAERLELTDLRIIRATDAEVSELDPDGLLHKRDADACCSFRKTIPLERALQGFDAWITGRKRFQGGERNALEFFEIEGDGPRLKINPLSHWAPADVQDYMINNRLPRHPLVAQGYPSIGCAPCTTKVRPGEDPRAGRWRGQDKVECGIHFINGKIVRGPVPAELPTEEPEETKPMTEQPTAPEHAAPAPATAETPVATPVVEAPVAANDGAPSDPVIVRDGGFGAEDWTSGFEDGSDAISLKPDADLSDLLDRLGSLRLIRVEFPSFSDGRGFTIARRLRMAGYQGRLRAAGHLIADQYAMARRVGFDEIEISADLARRQPWPQWQARADWKDHSYLSRLGLRRA